MFLYISRSTVLNTELSTVSLLETPRLNKNRLRTTLRKYLSINYLLLGLYTLRTFEKFAEEVTILLPATISTNDPLSGLILYITYLEGRFNIKNLIDCAHYELYTDSTVRRIRIIQIVERLFSRRWITAVLCIAVWFKFYFHFVLWTPTKTVKHRTQPPQRSVNSLKYYEVSLFDLVTNFHF